MARIDFSGLTTFLPEAVNSMTDLIKEEVFTSSDLQANVTIVDDIKYNKKVGYLTKLQDIGVKGHGTPCSINIVDARIGTVEKEWKPLPFDTRLVFCADTLHQGLLTKAVNAGVNRNDLTDTVYLEMFMEYLKTGIVEMYNRMIWMSDLTAARFSDSPAGEFSDTVVDPVSGAPVALNKNLINMQDGFFKKMAAIIAAAPGQRVDLTAENVTPISYALQKAAMTKARALAVAESLTRDMPLDFNVNEMEFWCTRDFWTALHSNFQGFALESTRQDLENGANVVKVNGVNFYWKPEFDWMIHRYQNSGTKLSNPHRVFSFRKNNFLLGVPDVSVWGDMRMFYNEDERTYKIDIKDEFDVQIMQDKQIAYAI
jgi:hypothetical protein